MANELKRCPFCGGEASLHNNGFMMAGRFMWAVKCLKCGASSDMFFKSQDAIEAWSRRVEDGE